MNTKAYTYNMNTNPNNMNTNAYTYNMNTNAYT